METKEMFEVYEKYVLELNKKVQVLMSDYVNILFRIRKIEIKLELDKD